MSRIRQAFAAAARAGRPAVMPYVTAGDPNLTVTAELLPALVEAGADIVELGVPYSDPLADGPTNQRAAQRALLAGTTVAGVLDTVAQARDRGLAIPIVLLVYYNCIYRHGEAAFVQRAAAAGVDGLIVPDLPPEEAASLRAVAQAAGLDLVPLAAPTSTDDRLALIGRVASGFIYCVSVTGVTGARSTLPPELAAFLQRVRQATGGRVPLAVGFGISAPEHVREVGRLADGVIIGSALVERLEKAASPQAAVEEAAALVRAMRRAAEEARVSMTAG
ncbi:MAG: tryptophan synthase subunit alpha [Bacillota bacterium]|nr:tryptophan synthase subunit alpha [Bacillota bacterium]REJ34467.1 MAG: tryptophan synthase subunit alpha [Bacillota bacterium]